MDRVFLPLLLVFVFAEAYAQPGFYTTANAHSHNDYEQSSPYWLAYSHGFGSIEADVFLKDNRLIVAHDEEELKLNRLFSKMYLDNILACLKKNHAFPYADSSRTLQLLIDIKTDSVQTLHALIGLLQTYPDLISNRKIFFVITGNRPDARSFVSYPDYLWFDAVLSDTYTKESLTRVKMASDNFRKYSAWEGHGSIPETNRGTMEELVRKYHAYGIKVRFWNAPDFAEAWIELMKLKVDYINTDHIDSLATFLGR